MIKNLFFTIILGLGLVSCNSYRGIAYADDNMRKVSIGMTKHEVIAIMGDKYKNSGGEKSDEQTLIEKISYSNVEGEEYELIFKNNQLIKWDKKRPFEEHIIKKKP